MSVTHPASTIPALDHSEPVTRANAADGHEGVLGALTLNALKAAAAAAAGQLTASTVSVSLDMTGEAFSGGDVEFACTVDRQTRTLIFMHAMVTSGGRCLIKATAIFRLA